jgi:hypothetical protein
VLHRSGPDTGMPGTAKLSQAGSKPFHGHCHGTRCCPWIYRWHDDLERTLALHVVTYSRIIGPETPLNLGSFKMFECLNVHGGMIHRGVHQRLLTHFYNIWKVVKPDELNLMLI